MIKPFEKRSFIAGGINPENVEMLLECINPYAIDIASGVEKYPGIKDHEKIKILIEKIKDRLNEKNS